MKKIFSMFLTFILIASSAVVITACNKNNENKAVGNWAATEATLTYQGNTYTLTKEEAASYNTGSASNEESFIKSMMAIYLKMTAEFKSDNTATITAVNPDETTETMGGTYSIDGDSINLEFNQGVETPDGFDIHFAGENVVVSFEVQEGAVLTLTFQKK